MKISVKREALLEPLQAAAAVVERRQTLPILANVLLNVKSNLLTLIGTDLEVEMQSWVELSQAEDGTITVPGRKLADICRTLPENAQVEISHEASKLIIKSGRIKFTLTTLPSIEFPYIEPVEENIEFTVEQSKLKKLIEQTQFAMAQQDVRYYLNGMLWEISDNLLRAVATDGHRMSLSSIPITSPESFQIIVPRKTITELVRLLSDNDDNVQINLGVNQLRIKSSKYTFTSKLIDGRFPDYARVIAKSGDKVLSIDKDLFKQTLQRIAILANEKHRGVRLDISKNLLKVATNNPEQEEAEEELTVDYQGDSFDIGFNVNYLLDAVNALPAGNIKLFLANQDSSVRLESENNELQNIYIVMPMRL